MRFRKSENSEIPENPNLEFEKNVPQSLSQISRTMRTLVHGSLGPWTAQDGTQGVLRAQGHAAALGPGSPKCSLLSNSQIRVWGGATCFGVPQNRSWVVGPIFRFPDSGAPIYFVFPWIRFSQISDMVHLIFPHKIQKIGAPPKFQSPPKIGAKYEIWTRLGLLWIWLMRFTVHSRGPIFGSPDLNNFSVFQLSSAKHWGPPQCGKFLCVPWAKKLGYCEGSGHRKRLQTDFPFCNFDVSASGRCESDGPYFAKRPKLRPRKGDRGGLGQESLQIPFLKFCSNYICVKFQKWDFEFQTFAYFSLSKCILFIFAPFQFVLKSDS